MASQLRTRHHSRLPQLKILNQTSINVQRLALQYRTKIKVIHSMLRANYGVASNSRRPEFRSTQELEVHHLYPVSRGEVHYATLEIGGSRTILRQQLSTLYPIYQGKNQDIAPTPQVLIMHQICISSSKYHQTCIGHYLCFCVFRFSPKNNYVILKFSHSQSYGLKLTVDESLNELLGACVRPPLLVDRSKNARGVILLQEVVLGVLLQGAVVGEETANRLSINFASGEVDETL